MIMPFFEYEYMIDDIKDHQKERESQQEQEEKQQAQLSRQMKNPMGSGFKMPDATQAIPKMPSFSMPSAPSFSMPKFP